MKWGRRRLRSFRLDSMSVLDLYNKCIVCMIYSISTIMIVHPALNHLCREQQGTWSPLRVAIYFNVIPIVWIKAQRQFQPAPSTCFIALVISFLLHWCQHSGRFLVWVCVWKCECRKETMKKTQEWIQKIFTSKTWDLSTGVIHFWLTQDIRSVLFNRRCTPAEHFYDTLPAHKLYLCQLAQALAVNPLLLSSVAAIKEL